MQATSAGTTQTQATRTYEVGSNPENGGVEQLPVVIIAEVFSYLSLGERTVAMSAAPASLRDRVAPHIPEPSVEQLEMEFGMAAPRGQWDEVQALLDKFDIFGYGVSESRIGTMLTQAIMAGHVSIVRHILYPSQLIRQELEGRLLLAISCNKPQIFRAIAGHVDFAKSEKLWRNELFIRAQSRSPEMFRVVTEEIGPYLSDEEFREVVGRPRRRLSDSACPSVDEPAGCLV